MHAKPIAEIVREETKQQLQLKVPYRSESIVAVGREFRPPVHHGLVNDPFQLNQRARAVERPRPVLQLVCQQSRR